MGEYLTLDIGGTLIKASVMNESFHVTAEEELPTRREQSEFLGQLLLLAGKYGGRIGGISACIAGFIDPVTGENTDFSVGAHFRAYNLKRELQKASGLPVLLENDSNCALLGEMAAGAGRGLENVALLTVGTGIGGAVAFGGKLYRGSHNKAGEAGFTLLCAAGRSGQARSAAWAAAGATSVLVRRVGAALGRDVDGVEVFKHLEEPLIRDIYMDWLEKLAVVTGNTAVLLDPEAVLIGGGICRQERFIRDLRGAVYGLFPHLEEYTQIRACETGNHAGRIGALRLLLEREAPVGRDCCWREVLDV